MGYWVFPDIFHHDFEWQHFKLPSHAVHGQYAEGHHRAKTPHDHLSESRHGFDEKSDCNLGRKLNQLLVVSYVEYYKILIVSTLHNYSMLYILSYIQLE